MALDTASLFDAAQKGHVEAIEALGVTGGTWTAAFQARSGDTVLLLAARHGHRGIVELALANGAAPDQRNFEGKTALMEAAQHSQVEVVTFLIDAGANLNAIKRADWTALMLACTKAHLPTVDSLLRARPQLHLRNKDGWTSFHIACREGHVEVIERLLQSDPNLWRTHSRTGRSVLHTAALHGKLPAVQFLLQRGAFPTDEGDSCGSTPLMDALRNGHIAVAELLIDQHGASVSKCDKLGRFSIHHVCEAGQLESFQFLLQRCESPAIVNAPALPSRTRPLHLASKEGQFHMVARLLGCGADPSMPDAKGRRPLDVASSDCRDLLANFRSTPGAPNGTF